MSALKDKVQSWGITGKKNQSDESESDRGRVVEDSGKDVKVAEKKERRGSFPIIP